MTDHQIVYYYTYNRYCSDCRRHRAKPSIAPRTVSTLFCLTSASPGLTTAAAAAATATPLVTLRRPVRSPPVLPRFHVDTRLGRLAASIRLRVEQVCRLSALGDGYPRSAVCCRASGKLLLQDVNARRRDKDLSAFDRYIDLPDSEERREVLFERGHQSRAHDRFSTLFR